MTYILDTNTVIYFFRDLGNVARRMTETPLDRIAIPSLVVYELQVGIMKATAPRKRTEQLRLLMSHVASPAFGVAEALHAAAIRADLERRGQPIGPYDVLIAAVALARGAILVTHNTKEFSRVKGLRLEDWY